MAVSAFKSSSRRGSSTSSSGAPDSGNGNVASSSTKVPSRRSRSVSAVSRYQREIPSTYSIKRDNPLFWSSCSPHEEDDQEKIILKLPNIGGSASESGGETSRDSTGVAEGRRGRSVSRDEGDGTKFSRGRKGIGRSLSRVEAGRRVRPESQLPVPRSNATINAGTSGSEIEQEQRLPVNYLRHTNSSSLDSFGRRATTKTLHEVSTTASSARTPSWYMQTKKLNEFGKTPQRKGRMLPGSSFDTEGRKNKPLVEDDKSIQGTYMKSGSAINGMYETVLPEVSGTVSFADVAEVPPDLTKPGTVDLILNTRTEYARKLEESQERARKLRAELASEEHHGLELSRILKEMFPDPMVSDMQKFCPGKNVSIERRKMSKRLMEEAIAYFDECVSISTFDSSDFSAPEDAAVSTTGTPSLSDTAAFPREETGSEGRFVYSESNLTASSSNYRHDSWKKDENVGSCNCIMSFIETFSNDTQKSGVNGKILKSDSDTSEGYDFQTLSEEEVLFDRVMFRNRVNAGILLLCGRCL